MSEPKKIQQTEGKKKSFVGRQEKKSSYYIKVQSHTLD